MKNVFVAGGQISAITGTISTTGANTGMNWEMVEDGATKYKTVAPVWGGATPILQPTTVALSGNGAVGDYLKSIHVTNRVANRAGVFLLDGSSTPVAVGDLGFNGVSIGLTGTSLTGTTGTALAATATATVQTTGTITALPANALAGMVIAITHVPTGGTSCTERKTILTHAAVSASNQLILVTAAGNVFLAGGAPTYWAVESPVASTGGRTTELVPFDQAVGKMAEMHLGITAQLGALSITTDASQVVAILKGTD
jgi:hypothetical protein